MKKYAFGVDIGGTTVKMGFFETTGNLLDKWEIKTRTEDGGRLVLPDIAESIAKTLADKNISKDDVEGIGMGVPGPVGPDGTVYKCVNLGWGIFNVETKLNSLTGLKVKAGNDANVAALGEMWQGGGKGYKSLVMVTLGTGVGGGVILDEHILAGFNGAAGELGHIPMKDDETDVCGCGKRGCLEQYASATGIVRITKRYFKENPDVDSTLKGKMFSAKDIWDAAKEGDKVALKMTDEVGKMLGKALATTTCVVNPEAIVVGGGMSKAGQMVLDLTKKYYVDNAFHASRNTVFAQAELGNDAGIYGGVRLVLE